MDDISVQGHRIVSRRTLFAGLGLLASCLTSAGADISGQYTVQPLVIGGGGFVTGLVIHPTTDLVYARTDVGGTYRWDEGTQRWTQLIVAGAIPSSIMNDNSEDPGVRRSQLYITESIAIAPSDSNVLYIAAGETEGSGYFLKSTNRGASFTQLPLSGIQMFGNKGYRTAGERLAVKPNDANVVLFGSRANGLWRSTNGGTSWTNITSLPNGNVISEGGRPVGIAAVIFDPADANRAYASVSGVGIYRSDDAGASWFQILGGGPWASDFEVHGGILYACGEETGGFGLRKYTPAAGWTNISPFGQGNINDVAVDPNNTQRLYAVTPGFKQLYRSTNGGTSWTQLATDSNSDAARANFQSSAFPWKVNSTVRNFLSVGEILIDPRNSSRLWFAEGMGMWRSTNISDTNNAPIFNDISAGIEEMVATDLVAMPNGNVITAAWDRIGFVHTNRNVAPTAQIGLSNDFSTGWSLATTPANTSFVAMVVSDHRFCCGDGIYAGTSSNNGTNWTRFSANSSGVNNPSSLRFGELVVSATSTQNMVWLPRFYQNQMYYTTNGGTSWQLSSAPVNDSQDLFWGNRRRLAPDGSIGGKFYFYQWTNGSIHASTNQGANFSDTGGRLPSYTYWGQLESVPGYANHLWFATGWDYFVPAESGLYRSTTGGSTFQKIAGVQEAWAFGFGAPATAGGYPTIYMYGLINNQWGVYRSTNEGATWDFIRDYPLGIFDRVSVLTGDPYRFGDFYIGWAGNSFAYGVTGGTPPPTVAAPSFSPAPGTYTSAQSVTISTTTSGATIRYTTNGSNPTSTSGTVYSGPVSISSTTTLKAIAYKSGSTDSSVTSGTYTISTGGGDGTPYSGTPISLPGTIQAEDYNLGGQGVAYSDFDASNEGRSYRPSEGVDVEVTGDTAGGAYNVGWTNPGEYLKYTVNVTATGTYRVVARVAAVDPSKSFTLTFGSGSAITVNVPDTNAWQTYADVVIDGVSLTAGTQVLRLNSVTGGFNLNYITVTSTGTPTVAAPTFSPAPGTYTSAQSVTISTTTSGATIRYTTNGSNPTSTSGTVYSGPVSISSTTTLKAIAYKSGSTDSSVTSGTYTINTGGTTSGARRDYWTGVSGATVASLESVASYPDNPNGSDILPTFQSVGWTGSSAVGRKYTWGDNYGERVYAVLTAPATGSYVFWLGSDDNSELWLSTDTNINNCVLIAKINGANQFDTATGLPLWLTWGQNLGKSTNNTFTFNGGPTGQVNLVAGQRYWIEVIRKEATGDDHMAVGWSKPGQSTSAPSEIIPGSALTVPSSKYAP